MRKLGKITFLMRLGLSGTMDNDFPDGFSGSWYGWRSSLLVLITSHDITWWEARNKV